MTKDKHQGIIDDLEQRIQNNYDDIVKNEVYGCKSRDFGEIDLYAVRGKYTLYFEIKSNLTKKSYHTAIMQLTRINEKYADKSMRNFYFIVYGCKDDTYKIHRVRLK